MDRPLHIVVEGASDAAILKSLLLPEYSKARYFVAGGRTSVETLARNLLVHESGDVIIVADSDTQDINRAREDRSAMMFVLRNVSPSENFDVFLFMPEIEILFFERPQVLESLQEGASTDEMLLRYGTDLPKRGLQTLMGEESIESWVTNLPDDAWREVRKGKQARELLNRLVALTSEARATV